MTSQCPSCGAHQPENLLCVDCTAAVGTMLAAAPQLIDQLDLAIAKQDRVGARGLSGRGTAHERNPLNWGALAARDALLVELALWGDDLQAIRRHPQAAGITAGIGRATRDAYRAIDRLADRHYLGLCGAQSDSEATCECVCHGHGAYPPPCSVQGGCGSLHQTVDCPAELWARPGANDVQCPRCLHLHNVAKRRSDMLDQARDMLFTVKEAAQMLGELGRIRVTEASIRGYLHRGRIAYRAGTLIRLGDLITVVADESDRRSA